MREVARGCKACDLYLRGTQTVFGEGPLDARIVFVGEQPGDQEDIAGKPFVGPAGKVLDAAVEANKFEEARSLLAQLTTLAEHDSTLIELETTIADTESAAKRSASEKEASSKPSKSIWDERIRFQPGTSLHKTFGDSLRAGALLGYAAQYAYKAAPGYHEELLEEIRKDAAQDAATEGQA